MPVDAAVRLCSIYTRVFRRQVAYHEAGHAVVAWLLGFSGVWVDMEDNAYRAIVRHDLLPSMLAVADGGRAVLARYLHEDLMFSIAGLVAEVKIAGYPAAYVEVDVAGRTSIEWDAVRVARIEAGLPVCGHKDCEIPFDAERITEEDVAEVIRRAEDEVFALLKTPVAAATSNSSHRAATTSPKRHRLGREDAPVPGEILNGRMIIEAAAAASRAPSGL